jgi:hypothetical protein
MWIASTLKQRTEKQLPPLVGIINAPTMRGDGSILSEPGYDEKTGLLFDPRDEVFPEVPDKPTEEDVKAALRILKEPLQSFPFVSDVDCAVALSAVVTALVRRSLKTAPLHAFSAPIKGSGKSKLVDFASVIATGEEAAVISQGGNDEEMEKRLVSCVLEGRTIIAIDNCRRPLADVDLLCSMLTQSQVSVRILGSSEMPKLPSGALVTSTGNNLVIVGDLTRRSIRCDLDPRCERPELRRFEFDPIEVAKSKRAELAVAALTILRAFHVAGRPAPEGVSPLGSFEDWSLIVRNALIWAGCADPVASMEKLREDDPEQGEIEDVITQWWGEFDNERVTAAEVIDRACESELLSGDNARFVRVPFRDALFAVAGRGGAVNAKALTTWLKKNKDRTVGEIRIRQVDGKRHNAALWRLSKE